jgi:hypothetical protein
MRRAVALATFVGLCVVTDSASATPDATREADVLFREGTELMARGELASACARFEASLRLETGIGTRLWLAECYEDQGRTASAQREFHVAAQEAHRAHDKREAVAQSHADLLEPRIVKIVVSVQAAAPDERVVVDGIPAESDARERIVPVDPGRHLVSASASGRVPWELAFDAVSPQYPVAVVVPELPLTSVPTKAAPLPPTPPPVSDRRGGLPAGRIAGIVVSGIGVAGILSGGALALFAIRDRSDYVGGCQATCPPAAHDGLDRALHEANAATASFIVGGALLATGGVLFFTSPSPRLSVTASLGTLDVGGVF